ncbi:hypothetical protein CBP52_04295 [Cellulomonas sp. PSBB021]|nr:hypothetical protein CBP52_04295 [Cellulomonas sp. PSBB021]
MLLVGGADGAGAAGMTGAPVDCDGIGENIVGVAGGTGSPACGPAGRNGGNGRAGSPAAGW